jgi:hypothetical protein
VDGSRTTHGWIRMHEREKSLPSFSALVGSCRHGPWLVSIVLISERKAWHDLEVCAVLPHVLKVWLKHDTPYLYLGRVGPFGPLCHEQSVDKKRHINTLFSRNFLNQQNMMIILFEYLIYDHNNTSN